MPAKAEGQRIEVPEGYVVMRPMLVKDLLAYAESDTNPGPFIRSLIEGCLEAKFKNGKPLAEQEYQVLAPISKAWNAKEDEVALPPASAQLSALPSTGK